MLDAESRQSVPGAPDVVVYADTDDTRRYYAFAASPRLATDDDGAPQISMLVYRHGKDRPPEGAQFTLTLTLGITDAERALLEVVLRPPPPANREDYGPDGSRPPPPPPPPPPTVIYPEWLASDVRLRLADGIELTGKGSLTGPNTCVISASLAAEGAALVEGLIRDALLGVTATYAVDIRAARSAASTERTTTALPGGTATIRTQVAVTTAETLHLDLRGPLRIATSPATLTTDVVL